MIDYIINCFILQDNNTLIDIYNYIKKRYNNLVELYDIKTELIKLKKYNLIILDNKNYKLSIDGNVILNDNKYYYSKIIINFYKKYIKNHIKYQLKEIRQEQKKLRKYLIFNKKNICIICDKNLPLCLLETVHLKPRYILNSFEKYDKNIVEFMCSYCHSLYDNGYIAVYKGLLQVSPILNQYDLQYKKNKQIFYYNLQNEKYFIFHYDNIYKFL